MKISKKTAPSLTVCSSFSTDTLIDVSGRIVRRLKGGPALFIGDVLRDEGLAYELLTGAAIGVEVLVTPEGEFGRVSNCPEVQADPIKANWVLVSTILDERDLRTIACQRLFVDVQGYVRDGSDFGKKRAASLENMPSLDIYCLKGTKEEIACLTSELQTAQRAKLLLITDGERGVELYVNGQHFIIPAEPIRGLPDTIGAGDTFFAYFVARLYRGDLPKDAAIYATQKTTQFLRNKLKEKM